MADTLSILQIGPEHHGTRMSLDEFAQAQGLAGFNYELNRGVIEVVDVPGLPHSRIVKFIRDALTHYEAANPGVVDHDATGSEAVIRMPVTQSERHPDIFVYLSPPPVSGPQPWEYWIPEIVVEVVSPGSEDRDYVVKRDDYLLVGVRLYWIVDPQTQTATVLTRRGDTWSEERLAESGSLSTPLLPGFSIQLTDMWAVLPRT